MVKNNYFFPKKKYKYLTELNLFRVMITNTFTLHLSLFLFVYSFFPDSHLKIGDAAGFFTITTIFWMLDFSLLKSLCLADSEFYFYLRMFFFLAFLQATINFIVGWDSEWRFISITLGVIYCFIFTYYTINTFKKLMAS